MKRRLLFLEENFEEIIMIILLIGMTVVMGCQIVFRYLFKMSLSWSEEITRYMFIWSAFMSVSLCTRKCISIKIDQFIKIFPKRGEAFFKIINLTISLLVFLYLLPFSWKYLMVTIESGQVSPAIGLPMYYVQSAPFVCFLITSIRLVQRWIINLRIVLRKDEKGLGEGTLAEQIVEGNALKDDKKGER